MNKQINMTTDEMLQDVIEKIRTEAYQKGRQDGERLVIRSLERGSPVVTRRGVLGLVEKREVK